MLLGETGWDGRRKTERPGAGSICVGLDGRGAHERREASAQWPLIGEREGWRRIRLFSTSFDRFVGACTRLFVRCCFDSTPSGLTR